MHELAASKENCQLNLLSFSEKCSKLLEFYVEVLSLYSRSEAEFFQCNLAIAISVIPSSQCPFLT